MFARATWRCYSSLVVAALLLGGCSLADGSPSTPGPFSPPATNREASPSQPTPSRPGVGEASPSVVDDGIALSLLGFSNGPVDYFSVPRAAVVTDRVDQPNSVTLVLSSPTATALASYYRRALPAAGFRIDRDDPATATLTFSGHGWSGAFTGSDSSSAVFLRPT